MWGLWFYGDDGEFEYFYGSHEYPEYAFRNPRLYGKEWTFDGDGWSSSESVFEEAGKTGKWFISHVD